MEREITIIEKKEWNSIEVRDLCVKMGWFTEGTNRDYDKMLLTVINNEPNKEAVFTVAKMIYDHTDKNKLANDEPLLVIEEIMWNISETCIHTLYSLLDW